MKLLKITFSLLVVVFVLIMVGMFIPGINTKLFRIVGPVIVFFEWGAFILLGTILIILTLKNKLVGSLKKFLLLTGISAVSFIIFVLLHNLTSGLLSVIFKKEIEEPVFFILAVIGCPIGFLIGAISSIVLFIKQKRWSVNKNKI